MKMHAALDADGRDLRIGDWVRVLMAPLSIKSMPDESKDAFSRAVGNTFQIEALDETGCIELCMWPKSGWDTIWLEPYCVRRFRRYKQLSKSFRKTLERRSAPLPPRYEIEFQVGLKEGVDIEEFGDRMMAFASGGGFACWPDEMRIKGSAHVEKSEPDAIDILEEIRRFVVDSGEVEFHEISKVVEAKDG